MELVRNFTQLRKHHHGCVATIGNFDGVHRGHQGVFEQLKKQAKEHNLPAVAVIFEPQPIEFFSGEKAPGRLSRLREKYYALADLSLDRVICLRFNKKLVNMPAQDFIHDILVQGMGVKYLIVGDDFRFGHNRQGDYKTLQQAGEKYGFEVTDMPTFTLATERVSSTRIRNLLERGEIQAANALLGHNYHICGRVAHGKKLGRTIGFPTANILLHRLVPPLRGVFAVKMQIDNKITVPGVANLGFRPTVNGRYPLLEVHLFNFSKTIYGKHAKVEFLQRLREEKKFDSFDELRQQIELDAEQARRVLGV